METNKGPCYRNIYFGFLNASEAFKWTLENKNINLISSTKNTSSADPQLSDFSDILIPTNKTYTVTVESMGVYMVI